MSSDIGTRITYGSNEHAQYRYELTGADPYVKFRSPAPVPFEVNTRLIGRYNFPNLMMAATAGRYFQVPIQKIQSALESYVPSNNRSQVLDYFGNKLLLDAYNANPSNVEAAIENFALLKAEHKMLILGEMYELGSYAGPEHRRIAELAASTLIRCLRWVPATSCWPVSWVFVISAMPPNSKPGLGKTVLRTTGYCLKARGPWRSKKF